MRIRCILVALLASASPVFAQENAPSGEQAAAAGVRAHTPDQLMQFTNTPGNLGLFVENKDVMGLTVRAAADNLLDSNERFVRSFFAERRTGPLLFTESRGRFSGPIFTLSISGTL